MNVCGCVYVMLKAFLLLWAYLVSTTSQGCPEEFHQRGFSKYFISIIFTDKHIISDQQIELIKKLFF